MKGLVKVTPDSIDSIIDKIVAVVDSFNKEDYAHKEMRWSWSKFKKIEWTVYSRMPFWYQYKDGLISHLQKLKSNASHARKTGDEIWLSELSYTHLIKMSDGNRDANPIYIINY